MGNSRICDFPCFFRLIEAAQLIIEDVSNRSFFQPLLNEGTGDVVGIVSALDILRFLSRQVRHATTQVTANMHATTGPFLSVAQVPSALSF